MTTTSIYSIFNSSPRTLIHPKVAKIYEHENATTNDDEWK
jgi:hypothetical protein